MFEQFKENVTLAKEFTQIVRQGLRSAQAAWQKATPTKKAAWLCVPVVIFVNVVADHFSMQWYYQVGMLVLVGLGLAVVLAMRHSPQ